MAESVGAGLVRHLSQSDEPIQWQGKKFLWHIFPEILAEGL